METFWASLDTFEKIMWGIAIPASIVFVIQSVMTFMGMDAQDGLSADVSGDEGNASPFQLFSFRNLINFMLGFSWMGISLYNNIDSKGLIVLLSTLSGVALVSIVMALFYFMSRMEQSGNIDILDTIGHTAVVYFPIEEHGGRAGKIQINIKGAVREYDALSGSRALKTGEIVVVKSVAEGSMLVVDKA